ncbi:MAG: hypothetical protein WA997_02385 [Anaerolineales bacterium]
MSQEMDFKKLQQRTYESYHQDGLIDIIFGLGFIGFGHNMALDNSAFLFMGWMPIIFYVPFKNRITVPRIGYVKFSTSNTKMFIGVAVAVLLFIFLLGTIVYLVGGSDNLSPQLTDWLTWFRQYHMLVIGSIAALCCAGAALLTGIRRLYAYAALIVGIFAAGSWLGVNPPIYVLTTGLLIEAVGIWLLIRFLRKYPIASEKGSRE